MIGAAQLLVTLLAGVPQAPPATPPAAQPPAAQPPAAQPPTAKPSATQMVLKGKAPLSSEILKVKLPRPQEVDLPNGLHLMVLEDHRLPQITVTIIIPGAGGYYDPAEKVGLANYTASLMREGTADGGAPRG